MTVLILLLVTFGLLHLLSAVGLKYFPTNKAKARVAMGIMFVFAGLLHFVITETYMRMMPPFLPLHRELVYLSGVFEVLGGVGLLIPKFQRPAAYGLVALLLAVLPANIYVAVENLQLGGYMNSPLYQWTRIPVQFVLIWWALWSVSEPHNERSKSPERGSGITALNLEVRE